MRLFDDIDDRTAQEIADSYPALSDEDRERIYAKTRRKLGAEDIHSADGITVSGVERYKRSNITRVVSAAACIAAVAGLFGSSYLINRTLKAPSPDDAVSMLYADRDDIAEELTDRILEAADILTGAAEIKTANGGLILYRYSSHCDSWSGGDVVYSRVTDRRFACSEDLEDILADIVTDEYLAELRSGESALFPRSTAALTGDEEDGSAPVFAEFSGELYVHPSGTPPLSYTDLPTLTEEDTNSFTAVRTADTALSFEIVWDGEQWQINDIERIQE